MEFERPPKVKRFESKDRSRSNITGACTGTENTQAEKEMEEPSDKIHPITPRDAMKIPRTDVVAEYEHDNINLQEAVLSQSETRPITEEQLVDEVKAIYAGLVMVEKKCIEIEEQKLDDAGNLTVLQWQALTALHRTFLHEYLDFFLACDLPVLKRLDGKYSMPARIWRYGIHWILELLRKEPPDFLNHMLTLIYLVYSMMTLLLETVLAVEEMWIECLVYLLARCWYTKVRNESGVGRMQHHLAVLSRPNMLQQLCCYSKSLVSIRTFVDAIKRILLLFNPLMDTTNTTNKYHPPLLTVFFEINGPLFRRHDIAIFIHYANVPNIHPGQVKGLFSHVVPVHLQGVRHIKQHL